MHARRARLCKEDTWRCVSLTAVSHSPGWGHRGPPLPLTGGQIQAAGVWGGGARYLLLPGQGEQRSEHLSSHLTGEKKEG